MAETRKRPRDFSLAEIPLRELIRRYEIHLQALNRQQSTIDSYKKWLNSLSAFLSDRPTLSADDLRLWLISLRDRGLSDQTVHQAYRSMKAFFNFCLREGYAEENPVIRIPAPSVTQSFPKMPTVEEARRLLQSINRRHQRGIRDYSVFLLMVDTGLRAGEVVSLKLEDLDLKQGTLRVMGKGRKHRIVPIGEKAKRALWHWIRMRPQYAMDDSLFTYKNGLGITQNWLNLTLARRCKEAGLRRLNPHSLRHFFATRFLANGGDAFTLQRILGHTTPTMVQRYVHMTGEDIAALHRRASPGDMLG